MTRDEFITSIYKQRRATLGWVCSKGVPVADAEIIVDSAITSAIVAYDKTGAILIPLRRGVGPWLKRWFEKKIVSVPLEAAERQNARGGRVVPKVGCE